MSATQNTSTLSRETMDRIAAEQGVSINVKRRGELRHVYIRVQGTPLYLGYQHILEQLSETAFTAKLAAKLTKEVES